VARVLLVQPRYNYVRNFAEAPSIALLVLGTLAQNAGYEVRLLHLDIEGVDIPTACKLFEPDIVGISVNTLQVKSARLTARQVREVSKDIKIVVGGPHAGLWDGGADEVVIGEGENRWLEILGERPCIESIDDVPMPNYGLVDLTRFCGFNPKGAWPSVAIMASRGCPFQCTFCNTPVFWGKKVRYRSPELVVDEVRELREVYEVGEVFFQDDTFNLNHEWAMAVFDGLIRKGLDQEVVFRITSRVNEKLVNKEFLDLAKRAGVWIIFYGVESGSQDMLNRMRKGITVAEVKRAVKMTREAGITPYCSFVVGLPGETWETLKETQRLIDELQPIRFNWGYACPFPGTEFEREVAARGHKVDIDYGEYAYGKLMVRTDALRFEDLGSMKGFEVKGGTEVKSWAELYGAVCGSKRLLEGNILANRPLLMEIARLVKPGDKVLEVGAGTGVLGWPLAQSGIEVSCLDNDKEILKMCGINARMLGADIKYVFGDAFRMPFEDNSFTVCFSEGLLEHYDDNEIDLLVKEHLRVASLVVIGVPLEGCKDPAKGDERFLRREVWEGKLDKFGLFRVITYNGEIRGCFSLGRGRDA